MAAFSEGGPRPNAVKIVPEMPKHRKYAVDRVGQGSAQRCSASQTLVKMQVLRPRRHDGMGSRRPKSKGRKGAQEDRREAQGRPDGTTAWVPRGPKP